MSILDFNFFSLIGFKKKPDAPWAKFYKKKDMNFTVPNISIYQFIKDCAENHMDNISIEYFGQKITYRKFLALIDQCARAFRSQGIRKGDVVSILSANIPEALISFYALNKIGAVANMLHPLLSENEIKDALVKYSTVMVVAMDITYNKLKNIINDTDVYKTIIISAKDSMKFITRIGYEVTQGYKVEKPEKSESFIFWKDFMKHGEKYQQDKYDEITKRDTPAVILQSGGTTGTPKGIVLSNGNFNAATMQAQRALPDLNGKDVVLGIMPIFHGLL